MIRVSVLDEHKQVLRVAEFGYNRVRIGRGSRNDFIINEPSVSREALVVELVGKDLHVHQKNKQSLVFNKFTEVQVSDLLIRLEYLDPNDDEITLTEFHIPKARREWTLPVLSFAILLLVQWFNYVLYDTSSAEFGKQMKLWGTTIAGELLVVMVIALISKAINGQYRFARILQIFSFSGVLLMLAQSRFFGVLWSLGEWTWYSETRHVAFIGVFAVAFWWLGREVFDHTPRWLRLALLVGLISFGSLSEFMGHLPVQEKWEYLSNEVPPPLPEWLETKPISIDDLLTKMQGASHVAETKPEVPPKR